MRLRLRRRPRAARPRPSRVRSLTGALPGPLVRRRPRRRSAAAAQLRVRRPRRARARLVVLVTLRRRLGLTQTPRGRGRSRTRRAALRQSPQDTRVAAARARLRRRTVRYRGSRRFVTAIYILTAAGARHLLWGCKHVNTIQPNLTSQSSYETYFVCALMATCGNRCWHLSSANCSPILVVGRRPDRKCLRCRRRWNARTWPSCSCTRCTPRRRCMGSGKRTLKSLATPSLCSWLGNGTSLTALALSVSTLQNNRRISIAIPFVFSDWYLARSCLSCVSGLPDGRSRSSFYRAVQVANTPISR